MKGLHALTVALTAGYSLGALTDGADDSRYHAAWHTLRDEAYEPQELAVGVMAHKDTVTVDSTRQPHDAPAGCRR
jgi:hypothetical protein